MKSGTKVISYSCLAMAMALAGGCGSSDTGPATSKNSYATTSSKGDYSEWTLTGDTLDASLDVVNDTGGIDYTYAVTANCGSADSFGVRSCTVTTSSCSDGLLTCTAPPSGSFDMMEVPGVALYVHMGSGSSAQLHVGFAKDSTACTADVSGDYTLIHTGLGNRENFGVYRSDADFINITHADFGFDTADANVSDQSVAYRTGDGTGTGMEALIDDGCVDGVRKRFVGGDAIRSMMTGSGLFVMDLPAGQGGLISFKTSNAATLADFANKSFGGISFPDNSPAEPVKATSGAVVGSQVDLSATIGSESQAFNIKALATPSSTPISGPPYPDFTVAPAGYSNNTLSADYTDPAAIPGMFKIDGVNDSGRVVMAAMKFSGKLIAVGMVYNYRTTSETNPGTGLPFDQDGLYNTGNFILFEK